MQGNTRIGAAVLLAVFVSIITAAGILFGVVIVQDADTEAAPPVTTTTAEPERVTPPPTHPLACNGRRELCPLPVNHVTFPTSHNADSGISGSLLRRDGSVTNDCIWRNQKLSLTQQLDAGIRALDLSVCYADSTSGLAPGLYGCHETQLGVGFSQNFTTMLSEIEQWMAWNRREVVFLLFTNIGSTVARTQIIRDRVVDQLSSLRGLNIARKLTGSWPSLQQAIDDNRRLFIVTSEQLCDVTCRATHTWAHSELLMQQAYERQLLTLDCSYLSSRDFCSRTSHSELFQLTAVGAGGVCLETAQALCNRELATAACRCQYTRQSQHTFALNFVAVDYVTAGHVLFDVTDDMNQRNIDFYNRSRVTYNCL